MIFKLTHLRIPLATLLIILMTSVVCDYELDDGPMQRSNGFGEERILNGVYEAMGQRYNSLSGNITGVKFWGRVNPYSGFATNTLKVKVYDENIGLPGVILGQTTIVLDSSSTIQMKTATFSPPISVNGNVIIAIEPSTPSTDDFYIRRNNDPDGGSLNLMLLKQGNMWFKNLGSGFNYDFMMIPMTSDTVTAGFSSSSNQLTAMFTNTSTGANSYKWYFGDGDSSTASAPSHTYSSSGTYTVMLNAYSGDTTCFDTSSSQVQVIMTGMAKPFKLEKHNFKLLSNTTSNQTLILEINQPVQLNIYSLDGRLIHKEALSENGFYKLRLPKLLNGIYLIQDQRSKHFQRFIIF